MKISQRVSELLNGHNFPTKIFKGTNSVKKAGGVMVLYLCISFNGALYLHQVAQKYLKELLSRHDFPIKIFKRGIIPAKM